MDVTDWLDEHPGGPQALMNFMGRDATEEFEMLHDDEVIPKYAASQVRNANTIVEQGNKADTTES